MKNDLNILTKELSKPSAADEFYSAMKVLPNPDTVLKQTGKGIKAYRELKQDAHLWSCIQSRKSGLLAMGFEITSGESSELLRAEVEQILKRLDMQSIIRDILEAPLFGWQPMEIIWEITEQNPKRAMPIKVAARPQEWFHFSPDGELMFRRKDGEAVQPNKYKVLCPRFEASFDNPYGHSLLAKCYWSVVFKNTGMKNWVHFSEKYGMPILMGQYTRGCTSDEAGRLADALSDMTEDSVIVTPADINITLHEAARNSSSELYRELIKYCNAEISKAILSQTLTTELDMGSYAAAQTHFKVRREVILSDIKIVEQTINQLIAFYVELNYGVPAPIFRIKADEETKAERLEIDLKIAKESGYKLSRQYLQRNYGFGDGDLE